MNTNTKLRVAVAEPKPIGLAATTWESRKNMTTAELVKAMGPLHCQHRDYKPRPRSLLPMPNLAGVQPVISRTDCGLFAQLFAWLA